MRVDGIHTDRNDHLINLFVYFTVPGFLFIITTEKQGRNLFIKPMEAKQQHEMNINTTTLYFR